MLNLHKMHTRMPPKVAASHCHDTIYGLIRPQKKMFRGCMHNLMVPFAALVLSSTCLSAEPAIRNLDLHGLQVGGTTTITIDGDDLGPAPRLLLPFIAQQVLKPAGTAQRASFDVTLAADVVPGYYNLRVVTEGGVSLPVIVGVDRLPQQTLAATTVAIPAALHGNVGGSQIAETTIQGAAGQKLLIEVEAQRLGSALRPVVHLYDAKRRQIAWSWNMPALGGDTRLEATLPEAGTFTIALHDSEYGTPGPGFYRMKIGQWSYIDRTFPSVVAAGQPVALDLLGLSPTPKLDLPAPAAAGVLPLAWPADAIWSGPRPWINVSSQPELIEQPATSAPQELPAGQAAVSGRLAAPFEEDRYRVPVAPGSKLRLEVFAERHGSSVDAAILLRNENGDLLARGEDGAETLDPILEYAVPAGVTAILVCVVETQGRGDSSCLYRLAIDLPDAPRPDFRLSTTAQRVSLPVGGRAVVPVVAERRGYVGPIDLATGVLPSSLRLENAQIPAGTDGTLMTIVRDEDSFDTAITGWRGVAGDMQRPVISKGHTLESLQPWLATELAIAPTTGTRTDFDIDWNNLAADAGLVPAGKLALAIRLIRPATDSPVRLTLLTSQLPPTVNGQPDLNRTIRSEQPNVELAFNQPEGSLTVLNPADLPSNVYDVSVKAELLTPDKQRVLATAFAPVRRMTVKMPVLVKLTTPRIDVALDAMTGATVVATGKIERREGLTGDVVVSLAGLPPGATAEQVTVKADATNFLLNIKLPANTPAGELKGLTLSATGAPDANQPNIKVTSRPVGLLLVLQPAT